MIYESTVDAEWDRLSCSGQDGVASFNETCMLGSRQSGNVWSEESTGELMERLLPLM